MLGECLTHCKDAAARAKSGGTWTGGQRVVQTVEAASRERNVAAPQGFERCIELGAQIRAADNAAKPDDFGTHRECSQKL
jgi:hypothetical protein